jgi:signal transduction histidine kinase
LNDPQTGKALSYEARQESTNGLPPVSVHSEDGLRSLLASAADSGIAYCRRRHFWQRTIASACDVSERQSLDCSSGELARLANLLDTDSFLSLPIASGHRVLGRLYLISRNYRYGDADLQFLEYMLRPTALIVENIQLLHRLTSEVATQERQRISRDLHDGTIQPYIGLKLGLEALRRAVPGNSDMAKEIDELNEMANTGIAELRRYVANLRSDPDVVSGTESLTAGVRRLAKRFSEFYGVDVSVRAESDVRVNQHLFNELMNIVREGLSNVRRHTSARRATVALYSLESHLTMEFGNDGVASERGATGFFPRSIAERARELGGRVNVQQDKIGYTTVAVEIPV